MDDRDDPQPDYFERVERQFGLRRGGRLMLSPRDWQLLQQWYDAGLPLEVVLLGINRAFDRFEASDSGATRINSLRYCRQHVEAAWQEHRERQQPGADSALAVAVPHLQRSAAACKAAAAAASDTAAVALRAAAADLDTLAARARTNDLAVHELDAEARCVEGRLDDALGAERRSLRLPSFSPWA